MSTNLFDLDELQVEDEGRFGRNLACAVMTVGELGRHREAVAGARRHEGDAFGEARNHGHHHKAGRFLRLPGVFKLLAVDEGSDVIDGNHILHARLVALAFGQDFILETGLRRDHALFLGVFSEVSLGLLGIGLGDLFQMSLFELVELFGAHVEDLQHVVVGKLALALESVVEALDDRSHVDFGAQFGLAIDLPGDDVAERSTHTVRLLLDLRLRSLCKCHGAHGQRKRGRENDFFQGKHNFLN